MRQFLNNVGIIVPKENVHLILLTFLLLIALGCQPASTDKPSRTTVTQTTADTRPHDLRPTEQSDKDTAELPSVTFIEEFSDVEIRPKWMDSCWPVLYRETWVDSIITHPKISRKSMDDGCVLLTLQLLEAGIIQGTCPRCLEALNAAAAVSDGYVGEAISDIAVNLYYNAPESLIKFMADSRYDSQELLGHVAYGFYYKISDNDGKEELRRSEVIADIHEKMLAPDRTEAEKELLSKLRQKVQELKLD